MGYTGTMQQTPSTRRIEAAVAGAHRHAASAEDLRKRERGHRRPQREANIEAALADLGAAAKPLRRWIGMCFAHEIDLELEIAMKRAVKALDRERRKLRKML